MEHRVGEEYQGGLRALSSIAADVWHADDEVGAYEWWYFDAVSADGRDVLVIIFLSGFLFSPRYNRAVANFFHDRQLNGVSPLAANFPAVAFCLYRDGRPLLRSIVEYEADDFEASTEQPSCRIGRNRFEFSAIDNRRLYNLSLDQVVRGGRRIQGEFGWQVETGDYSSLAAAGEQTGTSGTAHEWNLVAPRCSVTGQYRVQEANGKGSEFDFRGTGYHDHNRDRRWIPRTVAEWQWARAHFADTTAVFYRYREREHAEFTTKLYLARKDSLQVYDAFYTPSRWRRNHFGLRYPERITVAAKDQNIALRLTQQRALDSSFFYVRFRGDATLEGTASSEPASSAPVVSEHLVPRALGWRSLWWLINMRIGKGERGAFLP